MRLNTQPHRTGAIGLAILLERWSPSLTISDVLRSVTHHLPTIIHSFGAVSNGHGDWDDSAVVPEHAPAREPTARTLARTACRDGGAQSTVGDGFDSGNDSDGGELMLPNSSSYIQPKKNMAVLFTVPQPHYVKSPDTDRYSCTTWFSKA